ncbi:MAG: hypothetical protein J3T61_08855 [Candidatus Brocadiales bacterium]|nr:hypothetical protein [Candidatus Bathyanammoxibius sp.]
MSDINITLKDAVRGEVALVVLSQRPLKGKVAYQVAKAARKVKPEIEDYRKGARGILESYNAKAGEDGSLRLDPEARNYKKAQEELDKYEEEAFKTELTLTGLKSITLDDLLAAIPPEKDNEGKQIEAEAVIEPFVLEGIHWLLEDKD